MADELKREAGHKMGPSRLNHGNTQCEYCHATDLEILHVLGPICPAAPSLIMADELKPATELREAIAIALANADGIIRGNSYATSAYRAGVDMARDYWDSLADAAIASLFHGTAQAVAQIIDPEAFSEIGCTLLKEQLGRGPRARAAALAKAERILALFQSGATHDR